MLNQIQYTSSLNAKKIMQNSKDQQRIVDARKRNNVAIAEHKSAEVVAIYKTDFFILTSTDDFFVGKEKVQSVFQSVFDRKKNILFVRTPNQITISIDGSTASELGLWVGTWEVDEEKIKVQGDYYAKWHKVEGVWLLRGEMFTQLGDAKMIV